MYHMTLELLPRHNPHCLHAPGEQALVPFYRKRGARCDDLLELTLSLAELQQNPALLIFLLSALNRNQDIPSWQALIDPISSEKWTVDSRGEAAFQGSPKWRRLMQTDLGIRCQERPQTEAEHSWLPHPPSPVPAGASSSPGGVHCFPPTLRGRCHLHFADR